MIATRKLMPSKKKIKISEKVKLEKGVLKPMFLAGIPPLIPYLKILKRYAQKYGSKLDYFLLIC